jgi:hypothetical protein
MHDGQAGLFSAALTAFIIDSKQALKPNPSDQMVYYLKQNVDLLSQISQQIAIVVPQFAISAPPPPFPTFNPSASNIRVNVFWFMALAFSLSAALLAILVQQWVRDYMHVFQRYSDPLKSARIRQYLYEGSEGWYMPVLAEAVPGLLHVSLFLFFLGLGDFVLNINTTVGISTAVPIGITGVLYIFTTFAPVLYPQSPYQNSFSGLVWYIVQKSKLFGRRFKDRDGKSRIVNTNMAQGQIQLAMEETEDRKGRDVEAIRWLADNLTEDGEIESFVMAIPGSFNGRWSFEVWTKLSKITGDEDNAHRNELVTAPLTDMPVYVGLPVAGRRSIRFGGIPDPFGAIVRLIRTHTTTCSRTNTTALVPARSSANTHPSSPTPIHVVRELSKRIGHLFETCKNRGAFASDELWRKRTRACVIATALLVCYADAELGWFGDVLKTLRDIGDFEKTRESSLEGRDQSFVIHWTCLSMVAIRSMLRGNEALKKDASSAIVSYAAFRQEIEGGPEDDVAEENARALDERLINAWRFVLRAFCRCHHSMLDSEFQKIQKHLPDEMIQNQDEKIFDVEDDLRLVGAKIYILQERIHQDCYRLTENLPGIQYGDFESKRGLHTSSLFLSDTFQPPFIFPHQIFNMSRYYRDGLDDGLYIQEMGKENVEWMLSRQDALNSLFQRQLWRLHDLRDCGGLGFTVEHFLLVFKQLLSTSLSQDSHSALYIATFRVITSDWRDYRHSLGTQKILLNAVASEQGIVHRFDYPTYITDELLVLLGNVFEGQTGPHIENAMQQLSRPDERFVMQEFRTKALRAISRSP